jgi:hypothetical protein
MGQFYSPPKLNLLLQRPYAARVYYGSRVESVSIFYFCLEHGARQCLLQIHISSFCCYVDLGYCLFFSFPKPSSHTLYSTNTYSSRLIRIELIPKCAKNDAELTPEHTNGNCACYSKADDLIHGRIYWIRVSRHCQICCCNYGGICCRDYRLLCIQSPHLLIQECKSKRAKARYCPRLAPKHFSLIESNCKRETILPVSPSRVPL